jgi:hypothetical protein
MILFHKESLFVEQSTNYWQQEGQNASFLRSQGKTVFCQHFYLFGSELENESVFEMVFVARFFSRIWFNKLLVFLWSLFSFLFQIVSY